MPDPLEQPRELPDTLSGLLRVAVEDSIAVENTPGYVLNMETWYKTNGVCEVCMGGAVMLRSAAFSPKDNLYSYDDLIAEVGSLALRTKMLIIDCLRKGNVSSALDRVQRPWSLSKKMQEALIRAHSLIANNFRLDVGHANWEVYLEAADVLENAGL